MNINDLKVGDKVKYKIPNPDNPYCISAYPMAGEGIIMGFDGEYVTLNNYHKFYKKYIISKLEPLPPQYKEIKIDHPLGKISHDTKEFEKSLNTSKLEQLNKNLKEILDKIPISNSFESARLATEASKLVTQICDLASKKYKSKSSIKISDLKIGDRIRYFDEYNSKIEAKIYKIFGSYFDLQWDTGTLQYGIHKSNIICKLQEYPPDFYGNLPKYKEIPIEKEEKTIPLPPKIREAIQKSAPKSFKFDFEIKDKDCGCRLSDVPFYDGGTFAHGLTCYNGKWWGQIKIPFPKDWKVVSGKTYTIEIKEKEIT